jgi:hypothetical protein
VKYSVQIVDNFYQTPDVIRKYALEQKFYKRAGTYPGLRTDRISDLNPELFKYFANKLVKLYFKNKKVEYDIITNFQMIDNQYNIGRIHRDDVNIDVAGVVYLTPQAPIQTGTSIFTPIVEPLNDCTVPTDPLSIDNVNIAEYNTKLSTYNNQFERTLEIGNVYNRLVVYPAQYWHTQSGFFGDNLQNSRLTQVFFAKFTLHDT